MAENQVELERKLLDVLTPEYLEPLIKFLRIMRRLDELGVLDSLSDLLSNEILEDLLKSLTTTSIIKLLNDYDKLLSVLTKLTDPKVKDGVEKSLDLIGTLGSTGVLDTLRDIFGDPDVLSELVHTLINQNSTYLMTNLDTLLEFMARIRCCAYVASLNAARDVIVDGKSVAETMSEMLRDNDAKRGLRFMLLAAKYLGRQIKESELR
ncbi:DUF1641 domain-containing protein [Vulcanisaeta souniana]|uniref:DUF1641 domain-containing protein n=1 Tax=Vulcanisaeta souniana JCM 11219 TaxID=1293586 RepID=A0A830EHJ1_9CREN|nr:DUF1641 domain-containing protein [Vulcanisaeta souniana]BDR93446.1 hypothetical protein Vsou_25390 [Vulcanisaeta souniana JCM 11219]GGI77190.1 hypothetical protein GCM10007112_12490 [Vulcanisaeta souniana JCM 11219]